MNKIGSFRYDYICSVCGKKFILITDGRSPNSRIWFTTKPNLVYNKTRLNTRLNLKCQCGGGVEIDFVFLGSFVLCA